MSSMYIIIPLAITSCADTEDMSQRIMGKTSLVSICVGSKASVGIKTRSADENAIRDIHILIYDEKGNLLNHGYVIGKSITMKIPGGSGYTLYAIANTGDESLFGMSTASTEEKLKSLTGGNLLSSADEVIKNGVLPMSGILRGVSVSGESETISGLTVERMVAKIKISVTTAEGYKITGYSLKNLPKSSYYISRPNVKETEAGDLCVGDDAPFEGLNTAVTSSTSISDLIFYMYENRRGDRMAIGGSQGDVTNEQEKAAYAPDKATYVELYAQSGCCVSTYRIYLGSDNSRNYNVKRNSEYDYEVHINSSGEADSRVTQESLPSNSYIVSPQGHISIPVSRANEDGRMRIADLREGWTAELLWTDNSGGLSSSGMSSIKSVIANMASGTIDVTAGSKEGNAVIVAKVNGTIVWSWHLWVTSYDPSGSNISYNNGRKTSVFMDRNLGALSGLAGSVGSYGLLYEWGRKDPFPGACSISSTSAVTSIYNSFGTKLTEGSDGGVKYVVVGSDGNLENGIAHPLWYYCGTRSSSYDWVGSNHNDNLWNSISGGKSVYDPCPTGWRVPQSGSVYSSPWYSWYSLNYTWTGDWLRGWNWTDGDYGLGWYAATGYRKSSSGKLSNANNNGYYWSSSSYNNNAYALTFSSLSVYVSNTSNQYRSNGYAVRCVKE